MMISQSKRRVTVLLLFFLLFSQSPSSANESGKEEEEIKGKRVTTKLENWEELTLRAVYTVGPVTLFATTKLIDFESQSWWAGASTPAFTLGAVRYSGLLKEINNPVSAGPESTRLTEKTAITLDSTLDPGTVTGAGLYPLLQEETLPTRLSLFVFQQKNKIINLGTAAQLLLGSGTAEIVSVFSYSFDEESEETDGWFFESPPFAGDNLFHTALRCTFFQPWLTIGYVIGWSWGKSSYPDLFARAGFQLTTLFFILSGVAAEAGPLYRNWMGKLSNCTFLAGGKLTLFPNGPIKLSGSFERKIKRVKSIPTPYIPTTDEALLTGFLTVGPFTIRSSWLWRLSFSEYGEVSLGQTFSLPVKMEYTRFAIGLDPSYTWNYYGVAEKKLSFDCDFAFSKFTLQLGVEIAKTTDWSTGAELALLYRSTFRLPSYSEDEYTGKGSLRLSCKESSIAEWSEIDSFQSFSEIIELSLSWEIAR